MIQYRRSILLLDLNMEDMIEFEIMRDTESDYEWVKTILFTGAFQMFAKNVTHPLMTWPGSTMPRDSFLGYIAMSIKWGKDQGIPYPWQMRSTGPDVTNYVQMNLSPGVSCKQVAELTGWPIDHIREFYKDYLVITG